MAFTSYFNNSSVDYTKGKKGVTIWAFSKNVALIFDKPFAFKLPTNLEKNKYSIYVITGMSEAISLNGVLVWPSVSNSAVKIDANNVSFNSYDPYSFKKLNTDKTYLFDSNGVKEDGVNYFDNPSGIIGIVFRFETEYSRLDLPDFYFEDKITITDVKLDTSTLNLSYKAESLYMKNNIKHYIDINGVTQEITPIVEDGVYKYTLSRLDKGLSKINIIIDSSYTTQISKTVYVKKGEEVTFNADKSTSIVLYKENDRDYSTNGEGILKDIISAKVTEILNGVFNLDLELSITDRLASDVSTGCVIKCPVSGNKGRQLFKVRNITRTINKVIVFAQHIAIAKLAGNYVTNEYILNTNAVTAVNEVMSNTIIPTEIAVDGSIFGENEDVNIKKGKVIDVLINNNDSIKNTFNCDFEFDNFTLKVYEKRGKQSQNTLRYGKNIIEIEEDINDLDICTVLIPYSSDGITIPQLTIASPNINNYDDLYCMEYTFQDIKLDEVYDTEEKVQEALIKACINLFNNEKIDIPVFNYKATVKEIESKFKDTLEVGDEIPCYHKKLGLNLTGRIIEREFNPLTMENTSFNINFRKKTLSDILNLKSINETIKSKRDFATKKYVTDLVEELVEKLNNATRYTLYGIEKSNNENLELAENSVDLDYRLSTLELGL